MSTNTVQRRKSHKSGRAVSLTVLWTCMSLLGLMVATQIFSGLIRHSSKPLSTYTVDVDDIAEGKSLPSSPKINTSSGSEFYKEDVHVGRYASVWDRLARLSSENTDKARMTAALTFLDGHNYTASRYRGVIVSKATGKPVRPSTLMCYLNGYIPDRPYLKVNCPAY